MKKLRTYAIVDYLKQKKYCSIQELTGHFRVSGATMYRDIAELAARDVIQRSGLRCVPESELPDWVVK